MNMPRRFDDVIRDEERKALGSIWRRPAHQAVAQDPGSAPRQGPRLLDAGCGHGNYLALFFEVGLRAVGADVSPVTLKWAHQVNPQSAVESVQLESAHGLPHRDVTFDVIFAAKSWPRFEISV
jgi:SAM-dependent methyltransferase